MQENEYLARQTSGPGTLAVITLVLALVGLFTSGLASIAALVTGYVEAANIEAGRSPREGEGINRAGIIIAWITLLLGVLVMFFVLSLFGIGILASLRHS